MEGLGKEHELSSIPKMKMNSFFKLILQKEPMQELKIPPKFARLFSEELALAHAHVLILKGPSGKKWKAKLFKDVTGVYIHDGWREFHIGNSLGNKEFLLFEYDGKRSFEVHIFDPTGLERINVPVTKETNLHSGNRPRGRPRKCPVGTRNLPQSTNLNSCSEVNARLRAVKEMFTSTFPYFMTYMKMYSLTKAKMLYIPKAFAKVHFPWERADIVLRNLEGNTWNVVCLGNDNQHFFSRGWSAFIQDNKLEAGNVCVFELLSNKEFRVTIFR